MEEIKRINQSINKPIDNMFCLFFCVCKLYMVDELYILRYQEEKVGFFKW